MAGLIYELPEADSCTPLPRHVRRGPRRRSTPTRYIADAMGEELVRRRSATIKGAELDRMRSGR